jgi:pyrroloquinoline quinone biosynthesis protein D
MDGAAPRRLAVGPSSRPRLARHARLKFDETRERWVLLVPERVLAPDDIAVEILQLCDGLKTVDLLVEELAVKYAAPKDEIAADVIALLQDLADKGFVIGAKESVQ